MNPNGNHPVFPTRPDGTRDRDEEWDVTDTWKGMEEVLNKGPSFSVRDWEAGCR